MLNLSVSLAMSTSVLEAWPGKLGIKRHSPSILYLGGFSENWQERADLLALLCVVFSGVFVTFPYGVSDQVWCLIVLIPDLCLPLHYLII